MPPAQTTGVAEGGETQGRPMPQAEESAKSEAAATEVEGTNPPSGEAEQGLTNLQLAETARDNGSDYGSVPTYADMPTPQVLSEAEEEDEPPDGEDQGRAKAPSRRPREETAPPLAINAEAEIAMGGG